MKKRIRLYYALCCLALVYLGIANAYGYLPFSSPVDKTLDHSANQFHK